MFLPEMFPQCQFWIISTVFCPKWQLFASWIVQQFRRDTAYSGWNMVNARENATNGCFPDPYFCRIATTAFHSSWECFRYIFATWTRRPVPLSSCAKRRNNRDKWVRCKQKYEANNTNMADSVAKMVPSSKYRQYNGVFHPTSFGWDSDKILCWSLKKKNGTEYEPDSLRITQASLDRYLRRKIMRHPSLAGESSRSLKRL